MNRYGSTEPRRLIPETDFFLPFCPTQDENQSIVSLSVGLAGWVGGSGVWVCWLVRLVGGMGQSSEKVGQLVVWSGG
jgi:hypothetical protein